jgi:DHA2 family multidrug resistance protein
MASTVTSSDKQPPPPLGGIELYFAAFFIAAGNFLVLLDTTIANVSIPNIAASLGAAPHEGVWVLTSYAVADAITVGLTGWLTARFGPARTMTYAMAGFGIVSACCGLSTSLGMLVFFRVLQGAFGGPLIALSQFLIMNIFPRDKMPLALAIWTTGSLCAPVFGPTLGGYICDNWSWPWIFLINVPVTVIMCVGVWRILRHRDPAPRERRIDYVGVALMVTWIGAIQFVLDRGLDLDWFQSNIIVIATAIGVIGFVAFLIWELTEPVPIVNLRVFRNHAFASGVLAQFLCFSGFYSTLVLSPLWMQTNMGYTATWAGLMAAPTGMIMVFLTPITGWVMRRVDVRVLMSIGMAIMACSFVWRSGFSTNVTWHSVALANFMLGVAMSCFVVPSINLTFSSLGVQDAADANGVAAFMRTISIAFATALVSTGWHDAAIINRSGIVDRFNGARSVAEIGAAGMPADQALWALDRIVQTQAVMMATNDAYIAMAVVVSVVSLGIWTAPKFIVRSK